jgi:hypothetical protein
MYREKPKFDYKTIYIGHYIVEPKSISYRFSWNKPQLNANRFQTNFLNLLDSALDSNVDLEIIDLGSSGLFLKSNPFIFFKKVVSSLFSKYRMVSIPYINLPVLRFFSRIISLIFIIKVSIGLPNKTKIIFHSISYFNLFANYAIKLIFNLDTSIYLVDAPSWIYDLKLKSGIKSKFSRYLLNQFNYYIVNNGYFNEYVISTDKFVVLEGSLNYDFIKSYNLNHELLNNKKIRLVYAGSLLEGFGVKDFLIDFIDKNISPYEFHFAGPVNEYQMLSSLNLEDKDNIFYYGYLSSIEIIELYKIADFFVVPRKAGLAINYYSFPSKVYDYLSFGRPIVCFEMECFDQKWSELLIYAKDSIIDKLDEILEYYSYIEIYNKFSLNRDRFISNQYDRQAIEKFVEEFIGNL